MAIALWALYHQQMCGRFWKQEDDADSGESAFTDTGSWFSDLCSVVFSDVLFRDEAVKCKSLAPL